MQDWRLLKREEYLSNITLYKVSFPPFWVEAYRDKNAFYQKIVRDAERFVATMHRGREYLEGEKVQHFWHEHCEFCGEKAQTDEPCTFYCTKDLQHWICEKCFQDFQENFHWQEEGEYAIFK